MAKRSKSDVSRQCGVNDTRKPTKPYPDFPLFPHANGRWAKKIKGRLHYFGRWGFRKSGKLKRVPGSGWKEALDQYRAQADDLHAGRIPRGSDSDDPTMRDLCNAFLSSKRNKLDNGELSARSFDDYRRSCARLITFFGRSRLLVDLRAEDFEKFRATLAKGRSLGTLKNEINRCRIVLKYAFDQGLVEKPIRYGQSFDKPTARMLRKERQKAGPRSFAAGELQRIIKGADVQLRAMVLLGINGGLGNTDVAELPQSAIDWKNGWLSYPRPKTAIERKIPLWPETLTALRVAVDKRPVPKDPADLGLCFLTSQGNRWVRTQPHQSQQHRYVTINTLSLRFGKLLRELKIYRRKGLNFYTIRHCFETIAGGSKDQVAVDAIMGHVDSSMAAAYREGIEDARLRAVVNHVQKWLFGDAKSGVDDAKA